MWFKSSRKAILKETQDQLQPRASYWISCTSQRRTSRWHWWLLVDREQIDFPEYPWILSMSHSIYQASHLGLEHRILFMFQCLWKMPRAGLPTAKDIWIVYHRCLEHCLLLPVAGKSSATSSPEDCLEGIHTADFSYKPFLVLSSETLMWEKPYWISPKAYLSPGGYVSPHWPTSCFWKKSPQLGNNSIFYKGYCISFATEI